MGEHRRNVAKPLWADSKVWVAFLFLQMGCEWLHC